MSATATKERADTAVSSTLSGKPPHIEHTTACERNPQRERRQPSQTPQHRTTHPQQQSKTRAETAVSRNSSGNHHPSNAQRRVPKWTQPRKTPQCRTPETAIRGKEREYRRILQLKRVHNGACTQIERERAQPCQTPQSRITHIDSQNMSERTDTAVSSNPNTQQRVHAIRCERESTLLPDAAVSYHSKQQPKREGAGTAVSSNLTKVQGRVHSISRERAGERAQPCQTTQHF